MSRRSQTAKIRPLARSSAKRWPCRGRTAAEGGGIRPDNGLDGARARAGASPRVLRRPVGVLIPFPLAAALGQAPRRVGHAGHARRPLTAAPLIALSPWRHAPLALAALAAGWGVVALLWQLIALAR